MIKINDTVLLVFLLFSISYSKKEMNELPMYGGLHNPVVKEDKKVSKVSAEIGWEYYHKGNYSVAMKRFNQAWMFDRNNPDAYWGFGLVMGQYAESDNTEKNLIESIKFLKIASDLSPNNYKIIVDHAFSETMLGNYRKENKINGFKENFSKANELYMQASEINNDYPLLYGLWSVWAFYYGDYSIAKKYLDISIKKGYVHEKEYVDELNSKLMIK